MISKHYFQTHVDFAIRTFLTISQSIPRRPHFIIRSMPPCRPKQCLEKENLAVRVASCPPIRTYIYIYMYLLIYLVVCLRSP
jgi:hypothetical protein